MRMYEMSKLLYKGVLNLRAYRKSSIDKLKWSQTVLNVDNGKIISGKANYCEVRQDNV